MNPSDQPTSNSSSPSPYELKNTETGFTFTTQEGAQYALIFNDDGDYFPGEDYYGSILSFSIVHIGGEIGPVDPRIQATISYVLQRVFENNPNTVISYTCSIADKQEYARARIFRLWYTRHQDQYNRIDYQSIETRIYASAIWRRNHPKGEEIIQAFKHIYSGK